MKKIFLFLSFVFAFYFANAQVKEGVGGYATISAVTLVSGTTYNFTITGFNSNVRPRGQDSYTTLDIAVGCVIWSTDCNKFVIASVSANTGITMVGTMTSIDASQSPPTNGTRIAVFREITTNNFTTYSLPPAADGNGASLFGISIGMRACIDAHYRRQDSIAFVGSGSSTASNGLTKTGSDIKLGGTLTQPTTIITDITNTLSIAGLQGVNGAVTDSVVTVNASGILKKRDAATFGSASNITSTQIAYGSSANTIISDTTFRLIDTTISNTKSKMLLLQKNIGSSAPNTSNATALTQLRINNTTTNGYHVPIAIESLTKHPNSTPFGFLQASFNNGDGTYNDVMKWGFNPDGIFGGPSATKPSFFYAIEPRWNNGGQIWMEAHLQMNYGGGEKRVFTTEIKNLAAAIPTESWQYLGDDFAINTYAEGLGNAYFTVSKANSTVLGSQTTSLNLSTKNGFSNVSLQLDDVNAQTRISNLTGKGNRLEFQNWKEFYVKRGSAGTNLMELDSAINTATFPIVSATKVHGTQLSFNSGTTTTRGILMDNVRFLTSGTSQVDFFGGYASGAVTGYTGSSNIGIGLTSGANLTSGSQNVLIGTQTGTNMSSGSNNVHIGHLAGFAAINNNPSTSNSVIIGSNAGNNSSIGSLANKLYIQNSTSVTPLIGGDFTTQRVGIGIIPTTNKFEVDASSTGNPVKFLGLQQGASTDSMLTSLNGVVRRISTAEAANANLANVVPQGELTSPTAATTTQSYTVMFSPAIPTGTDFSRIELYFNGIRQRRGTGKDYTITSSTTTSVTFDFFATVTKPVTTTDVFFVEIK